MASGEAGIPLPGAGAGPGLLREVPRRVAAGVRARGAPLRGGRGGPAEPAAFAAFLVTCRATAWVVYAKPPFGGPAQVLEYLARYTHRVAIANDRLVSVDAGQVRFRWKDYARGNRLKTMTLPADEFLRRFLLHVLPGGFVRIRHFGFLANRGRTAKLARCRALLAAVPPPVPAVSESVATLLRRLTGVDIEACPVCHAGRLRILAAFADYTRSRPRYA